jgi:hypothetical protein
MARQQEARLKLIADEASYVAGVKRAIASTDKFNRSTKRVNRNPFRSVTRSVAGLAGAYIGAQGLITVIQGSVREQQESIKVGRQTNAVLKSTKSAAGLSAKAIGDLAQALSEKTAVDDEAIQSAENLLLTFTKIGKDTFPAATAAVLDLSAATGTSLKGASIQVGKALQDPIRGITALRRVGVNFSADQTEVIKKLVETGKTADAQKLILKELATEFGGSAAAQATPLDKLRVTYQNLLETLGGYLVPVLNRAAVALMGFVAGVRAGTGVGGVFRDNIKGIAIALAGLGAVLAAGKIAGSLTSIGGLLASVFSNPYTAAIAAVAIGIAAIGTAFYLAYTRSKSLQKLVAEIGATVGPIFKTVGDEAKRELPGALAAAGRVARSMTRLFVALKPVIVPIFKAIAAVASTNLRGIGPVLNFVSKRINALTQTTKVLLRSSSSAFKGVASAASKMSNMIGSAFNAIKGAVSRVLSAVRGTVSAFRSVGRDIVNGLASGIRGAAGTAIEAAQDLANALPKWARKVLGISSPSKVFAEIGRNAGQGLVVGLMATLPAVKAAAFGLGDELNVAIAARNAGMAKTKKGKRSTAEKLRGAERAQRVGEAKGTIRTFLAGILDKIKSAQLAKIMAPVDRARSARAAAEFGASKASLGTQITRAEADAANPQAQERYKRDAARLDARMIAARAAGNLEAADALQSEKDALDARYGPEYLKGLRDQLAQLNENEIERTSEAAATKFANTFSAGMTAAMNTLFGGGSVQAFFASIGKALAGSGVTPEQLADISGGVASGGLLISPPKKAPRKKPKKRASGGYMTPGALTLVGETGPELIVGGKVNSATRTSRMGGGVAGMNITINAHGAAANDPVLLARELGWQLATR